MGLKKSVVPGPVASLLPRTLLAMKILWPQPGPATVQILGPVICDVTNSAGDSLTCSHLKQSGLIQFSNLDCIVRINGYTLIVFIQQNTFPQNVDSIDIFNHTLDDFDAAGL